MSARLSGKERGRQTTVTYWNNSSNFYLADIITLMNGVCGIMSVFGSMRYLLSNDVNDLYSAMGFMPFGLFFDFFDGRVARWRKNASLLGQELDSLADLVWMMERDEKVGRKNTCLT